ncbi:protocadherin-8 [Chanos chanos]|uniref:Protocadherin-8 n=1 Tax=Chanos chanos TaxID=29144 RepID=A0A6J2WF45_CHACN|nr:protocadherin-8-like [Chanos chanos]
MGERVLITWNRCMCGLILFCTLGITSVLSEERTLRYKIYEEVTPNSVIGTLAHDITWTLDRAWRSSQGVRFKMMSQFTAPFIRLRESDGRLSVEERIDREKICKHNLDCLITFDVAFVSGDRFKLFHVEVEVMDINDNSPEFPNPECAIEISENAVLGFRIALDAAQDADVGTNSVQSYQISENSYFSIDVITRVDGVKYAELVLMKELDREIQSSYVLNLVAIDGGHPSRSGSTNVTIKVRDFNDNSPVFDQNNFSVDLPEDAPAGFLLLDLHAVDPDEGLNGEVVYEFGKQVTTEIRQLFKVDQKSGRLTLESPVDFEEKKMYELDVQASDLGPNPVPSVCKIIIHVTDVNDNAPEISITPITSTTDGIAYVSEATGPESLVALISTSDSDNGANGQVSCTLYGGHDHFKIHRAYEDSYTIVTTASLDREKIPEYNLTVVAEDFGSPPLRTIAHYTVRLTDVNDNAPVFSAPLYEVFIEENNVPGTYITTVLASDVDSGLNGEITYELFDSDAAAGSRVSKFAIMNQAGHVFALQSFNYEVTKKLELRVRASDRGWPQLHSSAILNINIVDQNDNAPSIIKPFLTNGSVEIPLSKDALQGYIVTQIQARDADEGLNAELSYKIVDGGNLGFAINKDTGEIYVSQKFNYDTNEILKLLVTVNDNGRPSLTSTATILLRLTESAPSNDNLYVNNEQGQPRQWAMSLIMILGLAGSCTVLLLAIVLIYISCSGQKTKKRNKFHATGDAPYVEKENNVVSVISNQPESMFDAHHFPNKATFCSPERTGNDLKANADKDGVATKRFHSKCKNMNKLEGYSTLPGYGRESSRPITVWKGNSMTTISVRDPQISGKDSGKGDSDFNDSDSDMSEDVTKKDSSANTGLWACTSECKILGHSDRCWSPSAARRHGHLSHRHLSTFAKIPPLPQDAVQRDGYYETHTAGPQNANENQQKKFDYILVCSPPQQRRRHNEEVPVPEETHSTKPILQTSPERCLHE